MGSGSNNRNLFLTVGGTVDPLKLAMKAGKSEMLEFRDGAVDTVAQVEAAFQKLTSSDNLAASRRAMEADYNRTFANIRATAEQVMSAPNGGSAVAIVNANASRQAAEAAEAQAAALKMVADAASRAAASTEGDTTAARQYATAAAAAYVGAQQFAQGLRDQAAVLSSVETELLAVGVKQEATADKVVAGHNRMGASGMILEHVVRSTNDSIAAGLPIQMVVGEQFGRLSEAMVLYAQTTEQTEGAFGKFAGFMGGPWGIAVSVAAVAIVPLIGHLLEAGDAVESETEKLKTNAQKTEDNRAAKERFARSAAGVAAAIDEQAEALKREAEQEGSAAERANIAAKQLLAREIAIRRVTQALLEQAQAQLKVVQANTQVDDKGNLPTDVLSSIEGQAGDLQTRLADNSAKILKAQRDLQDTRIDLAEEAAKREADPLERIKKKYDDLVKAAKDAARAQAAAGQTVTTALTAQLAAIEKNRKAEMDAERDRERKAKHPPSLGSELNTENGAQLLASAERYRGLSETGDNGALKALFRQAGMNVDPKMVAWCAAFVNAVLATNGLPGTGSLSSQSFLNYGTKTDRPVKGDIVVVKPDAGGHGHVGFFDGTDARGNVRILGGNTGNRVADETVPLSRVAGFRRAPTASEAEKLAERQANAQRTRDDELSRAEDRYARAMEQLGVETEEKLETELQRLEAAKNARDREIDQELKAGKYGDPASAEAQAEAAKLKKLNAATTEAEEEVAVRRHIIEDLRKRQEIERQQLQSETSILQLQLQLAYSSKDRLRLSMQILDNEEKLARQKPDAVLANPNATQDERNAATREEGQITTEFGLKRQQALRQNADPMQQKLEELRRNVGDINDAFKSVEADGLQSLEDGIAGVIDGTESLGSAFKKMADRIIADLIRIGVEKAILAAIGGGDPSTGSGGGGGGGFMSFLGSIFGHATGRVPGFAGGGVRMDGNIIRGPGTGTSDGILAMLAGRLIRVSNGESIMTERATRLYGPTLKAMNDNALPTFATGFIPPSAIAYPKLPDMRDIGSAGGSVTVHLTNHIDATGADAEKLGRVEQKLDQMQREFPGQVVRVMTDAKGRGVLRGVFS